MQVSQSTLAGTGNLTGLSIFLKPPPLLNLEVFKLRQGPIHHQLEEVHFPHLLA
jgi:hypothetical protein